MGKGVVDTKRWDRHSRYSLLGLTNARQLPRPPVSAKHPCGLGRNQIFGMTTNRLMTISLHETEEVWGTRWRAGAQ